MIKDYLKAGYPALCVLTYEPYRAEQLLPCDGWRFFAWDCIQGIKDLESKKIIEEIRDPVEAVNWLNELSGHRAFDAQPASVYGYSRSGSIHSKRCSPMESNRKLSGNDISGDKDVSRG